MPHLPFSTTSSASSSPTSSPSTPSIVLHPASGHASKRQLYKSDEDVAAAYRARYAQYLAATFNMSLQAALAEADAQLQATPRRRSDISEAEVLRES